MIYVYGDLSGTPKSKVIVAAIYLAHESVWAAVDKKWAAALREAKVDHFHSTDFFALPKPQGAFKGWKHGSKRWLIAEKAFTTAARSYAPNGVPLISGYASGIVTAAFPTLKTQLTKAKAPHLIDSMRLVCVTNCLWWVTSEVHRLGGLPPAERIQVFFEDEQGIGEVVDYFNYMKKRESTFTRYFLSLAPVDKMVRPAQVADLFAHESWKALEAEQRLPAAKPRPSFARMLEGGNLEVRLMTEEDVTTSLPKIEQFLEKYPRGYVSDRPPRPRKKGQR